MTLKEKIQYISAVTMLGSGILLTFICFFLNQCVVTASVLWYVAQTMVYAGSIFGVSIYVSTKMGEIKSMIDERQTKKQP